MNDKFLDKNLKVDRSMYEYVCVPLRLTIAFLFLADIIPKSWHIWFAVILLVVMSGLYRKSQISGNSWKCYQRAIIIYAVIVCLIVWDTFFTRHPLNINMTIGALLMTDVISGLQTKHIFEKLS